VKEKVVCLDLDDAIVGFLPMLCLIYNKLNGTCIAPMDFKEYDLEILEMKDANGNVVLGKGIKDIFKEFEDHGLYASLDVLPEASHALNLIKKLGYKIFFITAREERFEKQTKLNLLKNHIEYDRLFFVKSCDKAKIIRKIAKEYQVIMFFDDRLSTVVDVFENTNTKHVFLKEMPHNKHQEIDAGIIRVSGLFDTVRYLKDVNSTKES